jgi:hypothetical protein
MRATGLHLVSLSVAAVLVAACSGTAPSPSPSPEPSVPANARFLLRVTQVQALPPEATFGWLPSVLVTLEGRVLTGGAVPAIFPGPLVNPIVGRRIGPAGWARVVEAARAAGLLGGGTDFTGGRMPPGSMVSRLEIVAGGRLYELTGDASRIMTCITTPCEPQPGTPEAFAGFLNRLTDLASLVGGDQLGPEAMYAPLGYAIIAGPPPDQQGLEQPILPWPLVPAFADFGVPLADGSGDRCGTVSGDATAAVRPALAAANQLTRWRDRGDGSLHGFVVRPLLPGDEDPCLGLV